MSEHHTQAVWQLDLRPSLKHMLLALASEAGDDGSIKISESRLAQLTGYSLSNTRRLITDLLITRFLEEGDPQSAGRATHYVLRLEQEGGAA